MSWTDVIMNFLPELVGAFFGAYLGFRGGIRQERLTREEEERNVKNSVVQSIIIEHIHNSKSFDTEQKTMIYNDVKVMSFEIHFLTASFDSTIYSGKFSLLHPMRQLLIQSFYVSLKKMNEASTEISRYKSPEAVLTKIKAYERVYESLKETKDNVLTELQKELE